MAQLLPATAAAEADTTHADDISDGEAANTTSGEDQQLQAEERAPEEPDSAEEAKAPQESQAETGAAVGAVTTAATVAVAVAGAASEGQDNAAADAADNAADATADDVDRPFSAGSDAGRSKSINIISSDGNLVKLLHYCVTAPVADEIFRERNRKGPYESWDDLQARVQGLGAARIEKLRESNFTFKKRTESHEGLNAPEGLRRDVSKDETRKSVWRYRHDTDLYTGSAKQVVENGDSEVDHIWEMQLLNRAVSNVWQSDEFGPAGRTRYAKRRLADLVNSSLNLNVTTRTVNRYKCSPFKNWLKKQYDGSDVDDCFAAGENYTRYFQEHDNEWANIKTAVVNTYEVLENEVAGFEDGALKNSMEAVISQMNTMMIWMGFQ
jgi:DNA uptake protein ComE-like DNA-binding protein